MTRHPHPFLATLPLLALLLPLLFQTGCATRPASAVASPSAPVANLDPRTRVTLPPPALAAPLAPLHREQLLRATARGRTWTLHTVLDADGEKITFAGLSPLGVRLFLLTYRDGRIDAEQLAATGELPPAAQVLADIMLAWWPLDAWQSRLPAGWTLADDAPVLRTLRDPRGEVVMEIHYQPASGAARGEPAVIRQHAFDYRIGITTLADDTAP
ncbi:hypothetical protein OPIT5_11110 [Opitutaceae bacterium TAV5]|nr:hypothetical protein OPIT5_11110 [Opitutaceae bacterium TAV5]